MNTIALITGASTGIGRELAKIHAAKGGDLIIVARSKDKLIALKEELERKYDIRVWVIAKDLGLSGAPQAIYDEVKEAGLEISYLINNAGFGGLGKFHQRPLEQDIAMINLNIVALTALTHLFLSDFIKQKSGKILNVSSTASLVPGPLQAVYFATKAYVTSLSNALAEELSGTNVSVTNLMPGATKTEFGQVSGMNKTDMFKQAASASSVALAGYTGMIKGKLNVVSGLTLSQKMLKALMPLMPKKMVLKQIRQMQEVK